MRWALLLLACASGITSCKKERVATKISSGAIEAKVVVVQKRQVGIDGVGGGHVGIIWPTLEKVVECELQIEKPKKLTIDVDGPCIDGYELSASPDGKALAHAVQGKSWSIVYFGDKGRSFDGVQHPAAGALDWAKVPKLEETFVDQMRETMNEEDQTWRGRSFVPRGDLLLDEIVDAKDPAALEKVLLATIELPASTDRVAIESSERSLWGRALQRLPNERAGRVLAALAGRLINLSPSTAEAKSALVRAILYVDVDQADLVPVWTKALVAWLSTPGPSAPGVETEYAVGVLLARLAVRDSTLAGRSACQLLTRYAKASAEEESALDTSLRRDVSSALAALALSSEKCPAVAATEQLYEKRFGSGICLIRGWFCPAPASLLEAPSRLCTAAEARKPIDAVWRGSLADVRKGRLLFEDALVAAVLRQGPPPPLAKQLARQLYTRDVPAGAPDCRGSDSLADAGHADRCAPNINILDNPAMCSLKPAAAVFTSFDVHFDDAKKRIWFSDHDPDTE